MPREYREWGIELKDWASLSSITSSSADNNSHIISIQTRFMLPTVGCEADATSFVEDQREFSLIGSPTPQAAQPDVSSLAEIGLLQCGRMHYSAGPADLPNTGKVMIECGVMVAQGRRVRVRIPMRKWNAEAAWTVEKLEVINEEYSGPYKGGRELPMSCGAECGFSGDAAVPEEVARQMQAAADSMHTDHSWCGAVPQTIPVLTCDPLLAGRLS